MRELVGERCLMTVKQNPWGSGTHVQEYKVLEVSPSGNYVRLLTDFGRKFWKNIADCALVEKLITFEAHPDK